MLPMTVAEVGVTIHLTTTRVAAAGRRSLKAVVVEDMAAPNGIQLQNKRLPPMILLLQVEDGNLLRDKLNCEAT
jgi:hypothetical protein